MFMLHRLVDLPLQLHPHLMHLAQAKLMGHCASHIAKLLSPLRGLCDLKLWSLLYIVTIWDK